MKFYFAGHSTFGNRGCEALVRSTIGLLRERVPSSTFIVPSSNIELDRRQWPQAEGSGVDFVAAPPFPAVIKWWNRAGRVLPLVQRLVVPHYSLDASSRAALAGSDVVIMSGGDVISLDYGLASLYNWTGVAENAMAIGKPVGMWAASVGPFKREPRVEKFVANQLRRYAAISVRESATMDYLGGLGIKTEKVADPAFTLKPEPFDHAALMPAGAEGVIGLNVSPLIRGYRPDEASRRALDAEIVGFVRELLASPDSRDFGVLLIPHVGMLDGSSENSDHHYMQGLLDRADFDPARVHLAPPTLNAAQLKHLIAQCRFFIGARTHATIAAFSSGVPTVSIAYSVKSKGINQDLFGHLDFVLETPHVTATTLLEHLRRLVAAEAKVRSHLDEAMPKVRQRAASAADQLLTALRVGDRNTA